MPRVATDLRLAARRCRALPDETRLRILALLAGGERCVCELTDALDAGQSLLSHHLKTLREAGLVTDRREGRWVYYALNADAVGELTRMLEQLADGQGWGASGGCCR